MKLYRTEGILEINEVAKHTLIFAGLGSLGSMTLSNLAYPWGKIVLVDPENLGLENVERHLLGLSCVGKPKVEGAKNYLIDRGVNPSTIVTYKGPVQDLFDDYKDCTSVVVCNVDNSPRRDINSWCISNNIPAVYGGIYPLGIGGEIDVIPSPGECCYICAQQVVGGNDYKGKQVADYGIDPSLLIDDQGDAHAVPALKHVVSRTAGYMAKEVMDLLLGNSKKEPSILIVADSWLEVFYASGADMKPFANCIAAEQRAGLISDSRISPKEGRFVLEKKGGTFRLKVGRWNGCTWHRDGDIVSAEDI